MAVIVVWNSKAFIFIQLPQAALNAFNTIEIQF